MKQFLAFIIIVFSLCTVNAQTVLNAELIDILEKDATIEKLNVLVLVDPVQFSNVEESNLFKVNYRNGNIYSINIDGINIKSLAKKKGVLRIEYHKHNLHLMDDTSDVRNRINPIKLGVAPLSSSYDGTGIIIGIIDSGTDFSHPDLKDASGNSRIKFLWDMTKPIAANTPTAFGYGQEWTNSEIDLGLCTHDDTPHFGHGTASSGIAAGNGLAINHHAGVAPKADIIVVAMDFNRPGFTIADAVQYISTKAALLNKPFVINASVGEYYGSHDGTDLEAQIINGMVSGSGKCMVASAGNAGSIPFHVGYNVVPTDTNFSWISTTSHTIQVSEFADTLQFKNVKYTVGVNNTGYTNLGNIGFKNYSYALGTLKRDTIYNGINRIGIVESIASVNTFGVYELKFTILADSLNYLWRIEHTGNGRIDSWNFDYITSSLPSATLFPKISKYKIADTTQTIVSSFQCSDEIITVANYVNRNKYLDVTSTLQITTETPGEIAASSSVGPTRNNKIKPDIAATGATVLASAAMAMLPGLISGAPSVVAQGGYHITAGGTSASSPVVAGLAALYLQKNPSATNIQIKQAITNCAYTDAFVSLPVPNYRWGYGKLDGFHALTCGMVTTNLEVNSSSVINVYPNPISNEANILFKDDQLRTLKLINSVGQIVFIEKVKSNTYKLVCKDLTPGMYILVSEEKDAINKIKIVVL